MSSGYANRARWRTVLWIAFGLFVLTRVLTLTAFPIFNDEAIYLQYSQRIHENWAKNKFISINGEFTDWKPPLQYWLTAPFIEWGNDPLVVGRIVAVLASVAGFFAIYLFAKELFSEREGVVAAALYAMLYALLQAEDYSLLGGSILLFALLAATMLATRRVDWYALTAHTAKAAPAA